MYQEGCRNDFRSSSNMSHLGSELGDSLYMENKTYLQLHYFTIMSSYGPYNISLKL
jgi:hypothetical protein